MKRQMSLMNLFWLLSGFKGQSSTWYYCVCEYMRTVHEWIPFIENASGNILLIDNDESVKKT